MGALLVLLVLLAIVGGVAFHLGYLDPYIEQAKQKLNQPAQQWLNKRSGKGKMFFLSFSLLPKFL